MRISPLVLLVLLLGAGLLGAGGVLFLGPTRAPAPGPVAPPPPPAPPKGTAAPVPDAAAGGEEGGLRAADPAARRKALRALQAHPDPAARADLLKMLDEEKDPELRMLLYAALAATGDQALVAELLHRFETETDMRLRYAALEAAAALGGPVAEAFLMNLIAHPDDSRDGVLFREIAARGLVASDSPETRASLEAFLKEGTMALNDDPLRTARILLLRELGEAGGPGRVAILLAVAGDSSVEGNLREDAVKNLEDAAGPEALAGIRGILEASLAAGDPEDGDPDLRVEAIRALGGREEPEVGALLTPLATGERAVPLDLRREAIDALGHYGGEKAAATVLAIARDAQGPREVRRDAWLAYGRAARQTAAPVLEDAALHAATPEDRLAAARALNFAPAGQRRPALERILQQTSDDKVKRLVQALLR